MHSTTYNTQFLTIDFRLLDDPAYCRFMRSPCFSVYMLLRRYVWRGTRSRHPVDKVNELYREGFLVAAVCREKLAEKLELRCVATVSRHLAELERIEVIRKVKTGRENVYMLGTWEDRSVAGDGSCVIELFLLNQRHGAELYDRPRRHDVAPGLSESQEVTRKRTPEVTQSDASEVTEKHASEVTRRNTSEVAIKSPHNKEVNRETNRAGRDGADILPGLALPIPEAIRIPGTEGVRAATPKRRSGSAAPLGRQARTGSGRPAHLKLVTDREPDYEPKYPVLTVRC